MLLRSGAWKMMAMTMVMMTMTLMMMMLVIAMTRQRRPEIPSARGSCHLVAALSQRLAPHSLLGQDQVEM